MQVSLTNVQLSRVIELLEKSKENQTGRYLVSYLKQHQKPTYPGMVSLDEIPF